MLSKQNCFWQFFWNQNSLRKSGTSELDDSVLHDAGAVIFCIVNIF